MQFMKLRQHSNRVRRNVGRLAAIGMMTLGMAVCGTGMTQAAQPRSIAVWGHDCVQCNLAFWGGVRRVMSAAKKVAQTAKKSKTVRVIRTLSGVNVGESRHLPLSEGEELSHQKPDFVGESHHISLSERAKIIEELGGVLSAKRVVEHDHAVDESSNGEDETKLSPAEEVKLCRAEAERGNAWAQCNLGVCFFDGKGVDKDRQEAARLFSKAAEQGLAEAQFNLGLCYAKDDGAVWDEKEAARWFRAAAEQGLAEAQNALGVCYANGWGVPGDVTVARMWWRKADAQGLEKAKINLLNCTLRVVRIGGELDAVHRRLQGIEASEMRKNVDDSDGAGSKTPPEVWAIIIAIWLSVGAAAILIKKRESRRKTSKQMTP